MAQPPQKKMARTPMYRLFRFRIFYENSQAATAENCFEETYKVFNVFKNL